MEIYVMRNGEQLGPFAPEDAQAQIDNGDFSAADSAWAAGLDEWKPLRDVLLSTGGGAPKNKSAQKQKRMGRIRRSLRAIRDFVDRHLTTTMLVVVTILLLVASWVYPPGFHYRDHSHGWFFLFDTRSVMRVDFGRLILLDAIVVTIGGGFAWAVSRNSPFRNTVIRLAFYSLVAVPVIALIWGSAFLIQDANRRAEERTAGQAAKVAREPRKQQSVRQRWNWVR